MRPKIKAQYMCYFNIWWDEEDFNWPTCNFPCPLCYCGYCPLIKQPSLSRWPVALPACLWVGILVLNPWEYSNKPNTAYHQKEGAPCWHGMTKPASHSSCLFTLYLNATLALHVVWYSACGTPIPMLGVYRWANCCWSHPPGAGCHVFGHPINLG